MRRPASSKPRPDSEMQDSAPSIVAAQASNSGSRSGSGRLPSSANLPALTAESAAAHKAKTESGSGSGRRVFLGLSLAAVLGAGGWFFGLRGKSPSAGKGKGADPQPGPPQPVVHTGPPIKVGILHSMSGALAVSEHPLADASLLAIDEINARGGLLGRQVLPVVVDGKSEISAPPRRIRSSR